jgi:1-acyl-sn-glycerol-3-phosphate acyltransferase
MGNHQSHFDVPAVFSVVKNLTIRYFTKKELFAIPLFGWAMKSAGMVKIDRSNRVQAIKSMNEAVDAVGSKNVSLVVFPEGTRSSEGEIQKFKKGGFVIAIKGHLPILPVSISGSRFILKKHTLRIEPGTVKIVFDQPIDTSGYTADDKEKLMTKVREVIAKNMDPELNFRH